jgi:competence protein ComEC
MNTHDLAFWFCASFLLGVFFISIFSQFIAVALLAGLTALYAIFLRQYQIFYFTLAAILGTAYFYGFDAVRTHVVNVPFGEQSELTGLVTRVSQSVSHQEIILELSHPHRGNIRVNARRYPSFQYGDFVKVSGEAKEPPTDSLRYYQKENIAGIMNYPKMELLESGQGNSVKSALLGLKGHIIATFQHVLPAQKAAFLSGIVLGEREEFSKEFKEKMSLSGTTHLVALSGYNISVVAIAAATLFGAWFSRRISFYLSVGVIVLFVLMTGGEASIVRAAIMGIISLVAKETERMYSVRNAIVIAAFLMVLWNPRVLVFDLGFQLSFAALLGIVYLVPQLKSIFRVAENGVLNWKENAVTTIGAQLAVAPLLLGTFGIFSLTSFLANILILSAVPLTMGLGFLMGGLGFVSEFLARIVGLAADLLLTYELWIIDVFSRISLPIAVESFGFFAAVMYYAILAGCVYKFGKK